MRAVLLAAGEGRRMRPLTDSTPKCLLEIANNTTILDLAIENLVWAGIEEMVIVTGYRAEMVRRHVEKRYPRLQVAWVHNPMYSHTNNSYSLWLARDAVGEGFLLLDADILFDRRILPMLLGLKHGNALAVRTAGGWAEEDMKVIVDEQGLVRTISKGVPVAAASGESIGIEKFSGDFCAKLFSELSRRIAEGHGANEFYEASFQAVIDGGVPLYGLDISPLGCVEIDTVEDYRHAQELVGNLCGRR
ncbi:MAG: phosphocholine cytidylyltransferase family protein [Candidatus Oleimicrobiaceae bacterium]